MKARLKRFFFPPPGSPRRMYILPYAILAAMVLVVAVASTYGWDYTNSPEFCGAACHTMPPQNATYIISPHANVYCTECHIGRAFVGQQIARKTEDIRELYAMVFETYEFPIAPSRSRPARETCEQCHLPETFTDDSLRQITHYGDDILNTATTTYLIMKTGGGQSQEGPGSGIHWHIGTTVYFFATDNANQEIPYIRVMNEDGAYSEYVDVESGFNPASLDESQLKQMDCITCHNRVTHDFEPPEVSVDWAMGRGLIDPGIPGIHSRAVEVLSATYGSRDEALAAITALEDYYRMTEYYAGHGEQVSQAIQALKDIYDRTVFIDQKVDWTTYPDNLGHIDSPGCFRCHDGKHLNTAQEAIRLECNLCHSIPVVVGEQDFLAKIEISRGPEPATHLNPNWIILHREAFNPTCVNCHTTSDPGGTTNTSFCSNSACHGSTFTYAGFDAPALRAILQAQLPPPPALPTPAPPTGDPTYEAHIAPLFAARCTACHGTTASAGLDLSTYAGAMAGATDGLVILAGDSAASKLALVQGVSHFANFSFEELELVKRWIDAGALER